MLSKVKACGLHGVDGYIIDVETFVSNGFPSFDMVGLGDIAVKESKERVKAAIKNSGYDFPAKKIMLNLAPANVKKEGSGLDLPIAIGVLYATGQLLSCDLTNTCFIGELSLDGTLRPVRGILSMVIKARQDGYEKFVVPFENREEAGVVNGIDIIPVKFLQEVVRYLIEDEFVIKPYRVDLQSRAYINHNFGVDFKDVKGQKNAKRALEIAVSGGHNLILIGSPGCGKTMLAKRIPTIMPELSFEESLEVTKIHSISQCSELESKLIKTRPFRSPHHTVSPAALVGGGRSPKPGEISLAHYGVLFLDELPEFSKETLEVLRQPLEDRVVSISRLNSTYNYPANTTLVCAINPCKCGYFLDDEKLCTCSPHSVQNYLSRLSGPLLDRIDLHIQVSSLKYFELDSTIEEESSDIVRERVVKTRNIQVQRYKTHGIFTNSELTSPLMEKYCKLDHEGGVLLRQIFEKLKLSARAHNRVLKVARTIADMAQSEKILKVHIAEAIIYRTLDRNFGRNYN